MNELTTQAGATVAAALDALSLRQQVIAANLANVGTSDYRPRRVSFEQALQASLQLATKDSNEALQGQEGFQESLRSGAYTRASDRPGVEIDVELTQLSETVLRYHALIQGLSKYGSLLHMAILGDAKG